MLLIFFRLSFFISDRRNVTRTFNNIVYFCNCMTARFSGSDFKIMMFKFLLGNEFSCLFWQESLRGSCGRGVGRGTGAADHASQRSGFPEMALVALRTDHRLYCCGWFGCWLYAKAICCFQGWLDPWNKVDWLYIRVSQQEKAGCLG